MTGEAAIVAADQGADTVADRLGTLFDAHHIRLYKLARRMAGDGDEARDLVQETFLRAARSPRSIPRGAAPEEAWLVRVLVNLCRDRWRRAATRLRLEHVEAAAAAPETASPESAIVARSVIRYALRALPARQRAIVVLYELEGATVEDIARLLGVTRTTVRWHLSIGRRRMAKLLSP